MPAGSRRWFRRYWLALAIPVAFVVLWLLLWNVHATRTMIMTVLVTQDLIVHTPLSPINFVGDEPVREEVVVPAPDSRRGAVPVDVYYPPDGKAHGTLVLAIGAAYKIRDHPGVIRLSTAVARAGIVVVVPELYYPYKDQETLPEDVRALTDAFSTNVEEMVATIEFLQEQAYVDSEKIGVVGFSAGGGIALMAAADERIRNEVDFVVTLGTYYDMVDLISAITTRSVTYDGETVDWTPRLKSVRVMYRSIISFLPETQDRQILSRIYLDEDERGLSQVPDLSEKGAELHEAFAAKDTVRILALWRELSPGDVAVLEEISPSSYVHDLKTDLYILTGRTDRYIPYVESLRLRDDVSGNGTDVHYLEFRAFNHVEPGGLSDPLGLLGDTTKLMHMTWRLLQRLL
jgi:acetyl esterase/lipase